MKNVDLNADNLFIRLFAYSPRNGRREPLEDYCTEALAWCLISCSTVRSGFLRLAGITEPKDLSRLVHVTTQQSYQDEGSDDDEGGGGGVEANGKPRGRFDLVIEAVDKGFILAFESKVGSGFHPGQLEKYRRELLRRTNMEGYKRALLITITDRREKLSEADFHIEWWRIHEILQKDDPEPEDTSADCVKAVCKQFAHFLKEKGLGAMNLPNTTSAPLAEWRKGMNYRDDLEKILQNLKNEKRLRSLFVHKRVKFENPPDEPTWVGIYGNSKLHFWVGFGIHNPDKATEVFMLVQRAFQGSYTKKSPKFKSIGPEFTLELSDGLTYLSVKQVFNSKFHGEAMNVRDWLAETTSMVAKIPN